MITLLNLSMFLIYSNVPPSQGGKYSGFGYTKDPPPKAPSLEILDTTISSLSSVGLIIAT